MRAGKSPDKLVVFLMFAVILALAAGNFRLTVSAETRVLAAPTNPIRLELDAFEQRYSQNNNILLVLHARDGIFTVDGLKAVDAATVAAWLLPHALRVESITNTPLIESSANSFGVRTLSESGLPDTAEAIRDARAAVHAEPWLDGLLISDDDQTTAINIRFRLPPYSQGQVEEIADAVKALTTDIETRFAGVGAMYTGNVALMNAFARSSWIDMFLLLPLAFVVTGLIAFVFLRDFGLWCAFAIYVSACSAGAMGAAGWAGHVVTASTAVSPIIVMTVALASIIHFLGAVQHVLPEEKDRAAAVARALNQTRDPIVWTLVTTAIGFLVMNFSDAPPIRALGNIVAFGLFLAAILALSVIPALLRLIPFHAHKRTPFAEKWIIKFGAAVIGHWRLALIGTLALSAAALPGLAMIRLDDDFIRYFDQRFEYRRASDFVEDHLTGLNLLEFSFESGAPNGIHDPGYVSRLAAFGDWLRTQPKVSHVTTMADKIVQIQNALGDGDDRAPATRETIAQSLLLYELALPAGGDVADHIVADRSATRVTAILRHATSADIRKLNKNAAGWLGVHNPVPAQEAGTSINYFFSQLSLINIRAMVGGTLLALTLISILLWALLRDARIGLAAVASNLLPPLVGFGIWGLVIGEVGLAAAVVVAMVFGIVVDDTIHFLARYRKVLPRFNDEGDALKEVYASVGRAMVISSLALAGGFSVLTLSAFQANRSLGLFAAIIIMVALVVDMTLLPALLRALGRHPSRNGKSLWSPGGGAYGRRQSDRLRDQA